MIKNNDTTVRVFVICIDPLVKHQPEAGILQSSLEDVSLTHPFLVLQSMQHRLPSLVLMWARLCSCLHLNPATKYPVYPGMTGNTSSEYFSPLPN